METTNPNITADERTTIHGPGPNARPISANGRSRKLVMEWSKSLHKRMKGKKICLWIGTRSRSFITRADEQPGRLMPKVRFGLQIPYDRIAPRKVDLGQQSKMSL